MSKSMMEEMQGDRQKAIPIYMVVDTSWSMSEDGKIDAVNAMVPTVVSTCIDKPMVDQAARFSVIAFNNDASVVVPLTTGSKMPATNMEADGGTSYTNAFRMLRKQLEGDYQHLKSDGFTLYRPCVVFFTDGEPTCDATERAEAFAELTDPSFPRRPNMSVFGVGSGISIDTLKAFVAGKGIAISTREGANAAEALGSMVSKLMQSVVNSTTAGAAGDEGFVPGELEDLIDDDDVIEALDS
jgi:uncharacterized protein YegL